MMLLAVKKYIHEQHTVNLKDLAKQFSVEPELARQWAEHWVRKGLVQREAPPDICGSSCQACPSTIREYYSWNSASLT